MLHFVSVPGLVRNRVMDFAHFGLLTGINEVSQQWHSVILEIIV